MTTVVQENVSGIRVVGDELDAFKAGLTFPQAIVGDMEAHLATWAAPGRDGLVFSGTKGQPMRRATFYRAWSRAVLVKVDVQDSARNQRVSRSDIR